MNRSEYQPTITQAASDLTTAATHMTDALRNLEDQRRGLPGSGFGGSGSAGATSPVERALGLDSSHDHLSDDELDKLDFTIQRDQAQAKLDEIATLMPQIRYMAQRLRTLAVGNHPHPASDSQKRSVERANEHKILCEHCTKWRTKGLENEGATTGDVGGRIKPLVLCLCTYCYDFVRRTDRLPFREDVERNDSGLPARPKAAAAR